MAASMKTLRRPHRRRTSSTRVRSPGTRLHARKLRPPRLRLSTRARTLRRPHPALKLRHLHLHPHHHSRRRVCLWLTLALFCYWLTEQQASPNRLLCCGFAACCALNVLTKGLIGIVFPIAIVLPSSPDDSRLLRDAMVRIDNCIRFSSLPRLPSHRRALAHPHRPATIPPQGHPGSLTFTRGHWIVPLPSDGNVHGWLWFYFVNEHLLRYLNLRVPATTTPSPSLSSGASSSSGSCPGAPSSSTLSLRPMA